MLQDLPLLGTTVAQIELRYINTVMPSLRPKIKSGHDAYTIFIDTWDVTKIELVEQFKVMLLNRTNRVLGICTLSSGCVSGTFADPRQVFSTALLANAVGIIICHNHPSGELTPSTADVDLTRRMKTSGQILDVKVLDHLIVTREGFYSFATEGTL